MYRKVSDFLTDWSNGANGTAQVLEALTDETIDQAIVEGHSTLGWLGWHLATTPAFFASTVGVKIELEVDPKTVPDQADTISSTYQKVSEQLQYQVEQQLTDEQLSEEVESFVGKTPRGALLRTLIDHQTHHRGQMTVLLRQAGLSVPGVMGPTKENNA
ncbi:DinB family protein [Desertibacillus haloalkaliphilus]|uniref:DinB family protein n=1 Tax=Desertibacillus haloalkaliphilus TaxID=1328930 RepID=UPI001C259D24|nr:DinB family protein [Desertibacillus haloalkaliphilus]MBU8906823.1 DinB family protein [Desertibacillus haloalkaliphilus]